MLKIWRGDWLMEIISNKKITIDFLAEKLHVKKSKVESWLNGKIPDKVNLILLTNILELFPEDLFETAEDGTTLITDNGKESSIKKNVRYIDKSGLTKLKLNV